MKEIVDHESFRVYVASGRVEIEQGEDGVQLAPKHAIDLIAALELALNELGWQ